MRKVQEGKAHVLPRSGIRMLLGNGRGAEGLDAFNSHLQRDRAPKYAGKKKPQAAFLIKITNGLSNDIGKIARKWGVGKYTLVRAMLRAGVARINGH